VILSYLSSERLRGEGVVGYAGGRTGRKKGDTIRGGNPPGSLIL